MIHADDPDVFDDEPEYMKGGLAMLPPFLRRAGCTVLRPAMLRFGLTRLMHNPGAGRPYGLADLEPSQRQEVAFLSNNPETMQTEGEGCGLDESMAEVRAAGTFGDRPLYVLTTSEPFRAPTPRYAKETEAFNDYWFRELQPRLAALSTRGHLVVAPDAQTPEAIVEAVHSAVAEARARR